MKETAVGESNIFVSEGFTGIKRIFDFGKDTLDNLYRAMREGSILQGAVYGAEWGEEEGKNSKKEGNLVIDLGEFKGVITPEEKGEGLPPHSSLAIGSLVVFKVKHIDRQARLAYLSRKEALEAMAGRTWEKLLQNKELIENTRKLNELLPKLKEKDEVPNEILEEVRELNRKNLEIGPVMTATVRWVTPRVAHLDIGGVSAILPAKHVSWGYVEDVGAFLKPGDSFDVKVFAVDPDKKVVTASLKALLPDPWVRGTVKYASNGLYKGRIVRRLGKKTVLIELEPGILGTARTEEEAPIGAEVLYHIFEVNGVTRKIRGYLHKILPAVRRAG